MQQRNVNKDLQLRKKKDQQIAFNNMNQRLDKKATVAGGDGEAGEQINVDDEFMAGAPADEYVASSDDGFGSGSSEEDNSDSGSGSSEDSEESKEHEELPKQKPEMGGTSKKFVPTGNINIKMDSEKQSD